MADYGFSLNVGSNVVSQMSKIEASMRGATNTIKSAGTEISGTFQSIGHAADEMKGYLIGAFTIHEIYAFGQELLHLTAEFQGFENVIKYSSYGIVDAAANTTYLEDAIDRLHLPIKEATESFSEMEAGFFGTGIEGDKLRKVFEGVAEAASVLHLNPAQFSRVTFALKEVGELGTLQARQLRMLSFALPGAGNLAADAMGMSSAQLHEAMKKGEIKSSEFLPKFADALQKHFEAGLGNAGESLISQINDEKNTIVELMVDMGNTLTPLFSDILKTVGDGMRSLKSIWDNISANGTFVNSLKTIFDWSVKLVPIWIGYRAAMAAWNGITALSAIVEGLFTREVVANTAATWSNYGAMSAARIQVTGFGASMATTGVEVQAATGAMVGLQSLISSFSVGVMVVGLGLIIENFIEWNKQIDDAVEGMSHIKEITSTADKNKETDKMIDYKFSNLLDLEPSEKGKLYTDVQSQIAKASDDYSTAFYKLGQNKEELADFQNRHPEAGALNIAGAEGSTLPDKKLSAEYTGLKDAIEKNTGIVSEYTKSLSELKAKKDILDAFGIKPYVPGKSEFGDESGSLKNSAINTSNLAGAAGGLGQAKQITINISGPIQQNNGVKESKSEADDAVEQLIRMINNIADSSQNSM